VYARPFHYIAIHASYGVTMNGRWAINIDIESFSKHYEYNEQRKTYAILALGELMNSVFLVGSQCFPGTPERNFSERLFAHQCGDGFLVCSDFPEPDASRAIAIAVAIMRHMTMNGYATMAAISAGDLSDIKGCYPKPMRDSQDERLDIGMGLMTIISVMGTALTKAHKLAATRKGAVLILDESLFGLGLPAGTRIRERGSAVRSFCVLPRTGQFCAARSRKGPAPVHCGCRELPACCGLLRAS